MSGIEYLEAMVIGLWVTVPAYIPNSAAVLFGGGTPVDFGKTTKDGNRLLGDGKTWRGTIGGILSGFALGVIMIIIAYFGSFEDLGGFGELPSALLVVLLLASGSMFGDMLGSLIKRRVGVKRGAKFPILDQYDFLIGAWLFIIVLRPHWFFTHFIEGPHIAALIGVLVITPLLHRVVNIIGYKMGKKDVPW